MLRSLIAFCLSRQPMVLISFFAFLALGYAAFTRLNVEAYPDPAPPIIEIIAQNPGQSPEEMERYVTVPIEIAVASTPGLKFIRSNSVFALGFIRLQFEYGRDYYFVRQQTLNRLKDAVLPAGVLPSGSPSPWDASCRDSASTSRSILPLLSGVPRPVRSAYTVAPRSRNIASARRLAWAWSSLTLPSRAVSCAIWASCVLCALTLSISPMTASAEIPAG